MPPSSRSRRSVVSASTAFVSQAYPSYIHQMSASMSATWTRERSVGSSKTTLASWVIVKTKTRSKNSSSVVTRRACGSELIRDF